MKWRRLLKGKDDSRCLMYADFSSGVSMSTICVFEEENFRQNGYNENVETGKKTKIIFSLYSTHFGSGHHQEYPEKKSAGIQSENPIIHQSIRVQRGSNPRRVRATVIIGVRVKVLRE